MKNNRPNILGAILACAWLVPSAPMMAADFTVTASDSAAKTLNPGASTVQTGTVTAAGDLNVGGSTVAVTVSGTGTANVLNSGMIRQTGTGRTIDNSGGANVVTLNITNNAGALIQAANSDVIRVNVAGSTITLNNSGSVVSPNPSAGGSQALDWAAITTGGNTLNNFATGIVQATAADAMRPGVNGVVMNAGLISAVPVIETGNVVSGSDGIDAQSNTGVMVTNSGTVSGRHGITGSASGSAAFTISVTNSSGGILTGLNGSGINIDNNGANLGGATVLNNASIIGNFDSSKYVAGDGDGVDVDGLVTLTNNGFIRGLGAGGNGSDGLPNNPEGVSIGGGSIVNNLGAEITGEDTTGSGTKGRGILVDNSSGSNAFAATTVTNSGLIRGFGGYGIKLIGSFADTLTNNATGTIRGAGTVGEGAAIQTGGGGDTLTHRGAIIGDNGLAIDLQDGDDMLVIEGGGASISGGVSGGAGSNTLSLNPGLGNGFSFAGEFSNFATVEIQSGTVTLSGASTYTGDTLVTAGTLVVTNASSNATGSGTVLVRDGATLAGNGGTGAVSVDNGGVVAPGTSPGELKVNGDLNVVAGSKFVFEVGTASDLLTVSGTLVFTGTGAAVFDIIDNGLTTEAADYTLISFAASSGLTADNVALGTTPMGFTGALVVNATSVVLRIPEPVVNGSCGADDGLATSTEPSTMLCSTGTGTATPVSGSDGAWRWICQGSGGGSDENCSAPYASQTLGLGADSTALQVGSTSSVTASNSSGLVPILSRTGAGCTLGSASGTGLNLSAIATAVAVAPCTIKANHPGTADMGSSRFLPADEQMVGLVISKGEQIIRFDAAPSLAVGGMGTVSATGGASGEPVTLSSLTMSVCSVAGGTVAGLAPGTCTVAANQAGNADFDPAPQATQNITVNASVPTAPTGLMASAGNGNVSLSFIAPASDGGAAIGNYQYSLDGAGFTPFVPEVTGSPATIFGLNNGTMVSIRLRAVNTVGPGAESAPVSATPVAPDTMPNRFTFVDVTGAAPNTIQKSNTVVIAGINAPAPISVSGGTYSLGCTGGFTGAMGTVSANQSVCVRHLSSSNAGTAVGTTLTVGGVSDTFTSTTRAAPTLPAISIRDVTLPEGDSGNTKFRFKLALSAAATGPVTVAFVTANGTAMAGSDYLPNSGTVTFPAGTLMQQIQVTVKGNTLREPGETFFVNLSSPRGATLANSRATGTINNDD
ncbi:MAG: beta strand repeat-containing protein [Panacagrimonas sp.]